MGKQGGTRHFRWQTAAATVASPSLFLPYFCGSINLMMNVELTNEGKKGYAKLNQPILGRINDAVDELKKDSPSGDIIPLKGHTG